MKILQIMNSCSIILRQGVKVSIAVWEKYASNSERVLTAKSM